MYVGVKNKDMTYMKHGVYRPFSTNHIRKYNQDNNNMHLKTICLYAMKQVYRNICGTREKMAKYPITWKTKLCTTNLLTT